MFHRAIYTLILFVVCAAVSARADESFVGTVKTVQGAASVQRTSGSLPVTEGLHLLMQDTIRTGADGRLALILRDGSRISLGPNSEMKLNQFVYEPTKSNYALDFDLAKGIFAYISGKISKFSPESVRVGTPVGIIGVRGTYFAVALDAPLGVQ